MENQDKISINESDIINQKGNKRKNKQALKDNQLKEESK